MVYLRADTVAAHERVYLECEIERGAARWHRLYLAFWRKYVYLRGEKVQLYGIEEVHRVRLRVIENLLYGLQPLAQFALVLGNLVAVLVFPVRREALLGYLVHALGAYLHFYPAALLRHQRNVQGLIAVSLRVVHPVAQAVGMAVIYFVDGVVDVEAVVDFLFRRLWLEDNAHGENVVDFRERYVFVLNLAPDGVGTLHPRLQFIFVAQLVELGTYRLGELLEQRFARHLCRFQLLADGFVLLRVLIAEAEVFEFGLYLVQSEAVCQWRIYVEGFSGNLVLLVGRLRLQCAHIVQAVANLYQDYANVVAHGEQELLEVLRLTRCALAEDASADFRKAVDDLRNLRAEDVFYILRGVVGVLNDIVEQCCADACRAESYLLAGYLGHGDRVHDVWLARKSAHSLMCLSREVEGFGYQVNLLAMA